MPSAALFLFLPDYMDADNIPEEELPFGAIRVSWGHGAALTHRDILGSLMAQGVRREVLGDLLVGENGCDVIALRECIPFLRDNWLSAGRHRSAPGGDPPFGAAHSSLPMERPSGYRRLHCGWMPFLAAVFPSAGGEPRSSSPPGGLA